MKKFLITFCLIALTVPAFASGPHGGFDGRHYTHGHWRHSHGHWEWVVPAIIGGVIVHQITKPPEPVVVEQQTVIVESKCSPWTEIQNADGSITRTRTCRQ